MFIFSSKQAIEIWIHKNVSFYFNKYIIKSNESGFLQIEDIFPTNVKIICCSIY